MATQEMAAHKEMDKQCISTIRTLAMDAVQQAARAMEKDIHDR